jgi:NADPH-dependent curcumin reductase CurA
MPTNRQILLKSRPTGAPSAANFELVKTPAPEPRDGEVLLKTLYLSLDPYMRGRMTDGPSYAAPAEVGKPMVGGTVSEVAASRHPGFVAGDVVSSYVGWQDYAISNGAGLAKLDPKVAKPISLALGLLGMPGMTAYAGLMEIGQPKPGETVVVAAASGAVGAVVGQLAKLKGCRAVGIAGGPEKCKFVIDTLGFDACVDHRGDNLRERIAAACPKGIDVYFENVGGAVQRALWPLLNNYARVPVCGMIASYNEASPQPDGAGLHRHRAGAEIFQRPRRAGAVVSRRQDQISRRRGRWIGEGARRLPGPAPRQEFRQARGQGGVTIARSGISPLMAEGLRYQSSFGGSASAS